MGPNRQRPRRNTLGHTPTHGTRTISQSSYGPSHTSLNSPRGESPKYNPHTRTHTHTHTCTHTHTGIPTYHPTLTPGVETTPTFSNRYKGTSLPRGLHPPDYALSQDCSSHYDHFPSYQERRKQVCQFFVLIFDSRHYVTFAQVISMSADNLDSDSLTEPHPLPVQCPQISRTLSQGNQMMRTSAHDISHGSHMVRTPSHDCHMRPVHSVPKRRPISTSGHGDCCYQILCDCFCYQNSPISIHINPAVVLHHIPCVKK